MTTDAAAVVTSIIEVTLDHPPWLVSCICQGADLNIQYLWRLEMRRKSIAHYTYNKMQGDLIFNDQMVMT